MDAPGRIRIFIGTTVPPAVCERILPSAQETLQQGRWRIAPTIQWHVTALFLGEREARYLDVYKEKVERCAARTAPIPLSSGVLVRMPKEDPTMVWVRFRPSPQLTRLHHELAAAFGVPPSHYIPYWPHITLARSRGSAAHLDTTPLVVEEMCLDTLSLYRSDPGPNGSVHTPLATWALSGTGPTGP
jgi:RNA 2',3'-cyclic 3'-phosphodiesterase